MKRQLSYLTLMAAVGLPATLLGQAAPAGPPPILQILREVVKPGRALAHEKMETEWALVAASAKYPVHWIGISSLTGPAEVWFLSGFGSWADYEKMVNQSKDVPSFEAVDTRFSPQESEMLSDSRTMVARFRADLSYLPANGPPLGTQRYFSITRASVRPGHTSEFEEARKMIKAAHEKANLKDGFAMYEVNSGAAAGTFLLFVTRKSLAEIDQGAQIHGPAYLAALGDAEGQKKLAALASSGTISAETEHFAFSPKMSYADPGIVSDDPGFWKPKPMVPAAKKETPKKP